MNRTHRLQAQTGFTMIELIVVIVILGILSAVALPKFTNLQTDARIAKLNAARGSVSAAAAMVHGTALARQGLAQPVCPATGTTPTTINAAGAGSLCTEHTALIPITRLYPNANAAGIAVSAGIVNGVDNYTVAGNGPVTFGVSGSATPANCSFTYTAPAALGAAPVITAAITSGC